MPKKTGLVTTVLMLLAMCTTSSQAVVIYDNTNLGLEQGERIFVSGDDGVWFAGQPFNLGANNTITSLDFAVSRIGNPSGALHFELWDVNVAGVPETLISSFGSVDVSQLSEVLIPDPNAVVTFGEVSFSVNIGDLDENAFYAVVMNMSDVIRGNNRTDTIEFGATRSADGSMGAPGYLVNFAFFQDPPFQDGDWVDVGASFGEATPRFAQLAVEATFVPEPSSLMLLCVGNLILLMRFRNRRSRVKVANP